MDTYQGKSKTVSPAIGPYDIQFYFDIDKYSVTGASITGCGTLTLVDVAFGITGINSNNFTNSTHGY